MIRMLSQHYPIAVICESLGWARSTYYHQPISRDDAALKQAIEAVVVEWPTYGYRRVTEQLQRHEWVVNHKRVARVLLTGAGVRISMAETGHPEQNGYAERLMRTIKEEEVDLSEYADYHDALRQLGRFLDEVYMHKRIHSSRGYLTPVEFECQWRNQHNLASGVITKHRLKSVQL
jgi:transposase InsO family protein